VGKNLNKFFDWISVKKYSDQIPYTYIEEELKKNKRIPWIVKRKVLINGGDSGKREKVKYIELRVPEKYDQPFFSKKPDRTDIVHPVDDFNVIKGSDINYDKVMDVFFDDDPLKNGQFNDNFEEKSYLSETEEIMGFPEEAFENEFISNADSYDNLESNDEETYNAEDFTVRYTVDEIRQNRIYDISGDSIHSPESSVAVNRDEKAAEYDLGEIKNEVSEKESPAQQLLKKPFSEVRTEPEVVDLRDDKVFTELRINQEYIIPTGFLNASKPIDSNTMASEIKRNSELLVRTLADFGIESRVINVNRGPVITLYEMQIAAGIKITKVVGLSDDIAMALAAYRVRIVAPIPGKSAIGVELPNKAREMVTLGDIIKSDEYQDKKGSLKVGLGKDILGKPITLDLKKQPHLLIAGSTGSGKSVCVNSIITSIVYNYDPNYVRFLMVDPKMVELQLYNGMPHLLTPVITEPHVAPSVLKWAIYEMERRYRLLASKNTRDIETYNSKVECARRGEEKLPFIVIIIDELADLMMVASKEIEGYITRLAQKARAIGIHLVLATQRPSVDVITGVIKANFPARIAFQVAQKTDSRTILDQNGAEKLLGKGDMLYQSPLTSYPVRIQGAFISEDETVQVVEHLRILGKPQYIDIEDALRENETDTDLGEDGDEMFVEALKIIEETRKASASYLQRRLSIGYNRAARMIERMEEMGYIGPQQGSKPREVFI